MVEPFDTLVSVVFIDTILPWPFELAAYGFPDESVTEIVVPGTIYKFDDYLTTFLIDNVRYLPDRPSLKPGLL